MTKEQKSVITGFLTKAAFVVAATAYVISSDASLKDWVLDRNYMPQSQFQEFKKDWIRETQLLRVEVFNNSKVLDQIYRDLGYYKLTCNSEQVSDR